MKTTEANFPYSIGPDGTLTFHGDRAAFLRRKPVYVPTARRTPWWKDALITAGVMLTMAGFGTGAMYATLAACMLVTPAAI